MKSTFQEDLNMTKIWCFKSAQLLNLKLEILLVASSVKVQQYYELSKSCRE